MQITDMVGEAVDRALRQLTANGGGTPQPAAGYQHAARTKEELLASPVADQTTVPRDQELVTDAMDPEFLAEIQKDQKEPGEILLPKEDGNGSWAF